MALNIQSGQTWAEIRAELNNKAFDKNGDEMSGALGIDDIILDAEGQNAIETDSETQRIKLYGRYVGDPVYSQTSVSFDVLQGTGENIHSIELPASNYNRGMCFVEIINADTLRENETIYGIKDEFKCVYWFSRNPDGYMGIGIDEHDITRFIYSAYPIDSVLQRIYIEDNFIKIAGVSHPDSFMGRGDSRITIKAWEVW